MKNFYRNRYKVIKYFYKRHSMIVIGSKKHELNLFDADIFSHLV